MSLGTNLALALIIVFQEHILPVQNQSAMLVWFVRRVQDIQNSQVFCKSRTALVYDKHIQAYYFLDFLVFP